MQKLFMDCLFSAELKGKDAFTYFTEDSKQFTVVCTFSHYRMYWHTPYWVSGSCVWAWGSAAGVRVGKVHYWDTQENWNQPPFKLWLFPPRAANWSCEDEAHSPHCHGSSSVPGQRLSWTQHSARFCWPAAKPALYCHCQSEITSYKPILSNLRRGVNLSWSVWRPNRRFCCWF